jgi:pSer/pThr/pTyr-binding forkhead associated (FHA) protein
LRPQEAWIEIVNRGAVAPSSPDRRYSLGRTLLRIGRETDNDVCLEDITVHRYHAAIHRTEDAEFVVTDLSSSGGNGVVVNGRAVAEARLGNGDMIELGNAQIKFSTAQHG